MSDLAEFLLARIAEDEAVARIATPAPWHAGDPAQEVPWEACGSGWYVYAESRDYWGPVAAGPWGGDLGKDADHIARHDPARVLAECEAKRRIVMQYQNCHYVRGGPTLDVIGWQEEQTGYGRGLERALKILAIPFAGHPDYQAAWNPDPLPLRVTCSASTWREGPVYLTCDLPPSHADPQHRTALGTSF